LFYIILYSFHSNAFQTNVWPRDNFGFSLVQHRNLFAGFALAYELRVSIFCGCFRDKLSDTQILRYSNWCCFGCFCSQPAGGIPWPNKLEL